jgi:hypothetical protein
MGGGNVEKRPECDVRGRSKGQNGKNTVAFAKTVRLAVKGEDYATEIVGDKA